MAKRDFFCGYFFKARFFGVSAQFELTSGRQGATVEQVAKLAVHDLAPFRAAMAFVEQPADEPKPDSPQSGADD
jgi:hypothetical protein